MEEILEQDLKILRDCSPWHICWTEQSGGGHITPTSKITIKLDKECKVIESIIIQKYNENGDDVIHCTTESINIICKKIEPKTDRAYMLTFDVEEVNCPNHTHHVVLCFDLNHKSNRGDKAYYFTYYSEDNKRNDIVEIKKLHGRGGGGPG